MASSYVILNLSELLRGVFSNVINIWVKKLINIITNKTNTYGKDEFIELFERHHVLSRAEIESRVIIYLETYSKQIKQYGNKDRAKQRCEADRYHLLNLTHLARGRNRIEFRAFAGTLNKTKVMGYLMMCLGLVELALNTKRCSDWDYTKREGTKSCWDRPGAGEGETELNRLFYRLGWTKGWYKGELRNKVFGQLAGETTTPDWKTIKTKLIELARKYDGAARAAA